MKSRRMKTFQAWAVVHREDGLPWCLEGINGDTPMQVYAFKHEKSQVLTRNQRWARVTVREVVVKKRKGKR